MRYAVPLLRRQSEASSRMDHSACDREPCVRCNAQAHMTADDWGCVEFYLRVASQVVDLTPFGTKDGSPHVLVPRLEAWESVLRMFVPDQARWSDRIEVALDLFQVMQGRARVPEVWKLAPAVIAPLDIDEVATEGEQLLGAALREAVDA